MERAVRRAILHDEAKEKKRARKAARGLASNAPTPPTTGMPTPERRSSFVEPVSQAVDVDVEKAAGTGAGTGAGKRKSPFSRLGINFGSSGASGDEDEEKIQPGWRDVNPFPTMWSIFHQPTNAVVLFASGILFAAQYTIVYTAAITLAKEPYAYNALHIGLVLLSFGVGNMAGSLGGGKYSDVVLRRLKEKNGGVGVPEVSSVKHDQGISYHATPHNSASQALLIWQLDATQSRHSRHPIPRRVFPRLRMDSRQNGTYQCHSHYPSLRRVFNHVSWLIHFY